MPTRPQPSAAVPATSATSSRDDQDMITAVLWDKVYSTFAARLEALLPDAMKPPPVLSQLDHIDDRRYYIGRAITEALNELGSEAQQLRGHRLIRLEVLRQVGELCEELIRREVDSVPGRGSEKFARMVRYLLARYLQEEERHDAHPWRATRSAQVGLDPNDPPPFKAPPMPPHPNDPTTEGA